MREQVPEVKFVVGHGQMSATQLEEVMSAFYDGEYDVLVSTTIVESGLDIPTANTLIVHRADMFGLAQLYQIRGRVGRSKARAFAYLTTDAVKPMTLSAERRLQVLQSLDNLGAGFQLASHDLDQRGGGNLLGDEQSGHIREVGVELYQQMLEDAVAELREKGEGQPVDRGWSPSINVGASVLIPEDYVPDLNVRLSLYRRLSDAEQAEDREALAAELIDRFGPLPDEAQQLLKIVGIKSNCRKACIEKIDIGPRGAVLTLRDNSFPNPAGLVGLIQKNHAFWKIRPDQKIVVSGDWPTAEERLKVAERITADLARSGGGVKPLSASFRTGRPKRAQAGRRRFRRDAFGGADVELGDERRPVRAGVEGGAADHGRDSFCGQTRRFSVGRGQGQGEDLLGQAGRGVLDADQARNHGPDLRHGAIQPTALTRPGDGFGFAHPQDADRKRALARARSLGDAAQVAGEQFGREQARFRVHHFQAADRVQRLANAQMNAVRAGQGQDPLGRFALGRVGGRDIGEAAIEQFSQADLVPAAQIEHQRNMIEARVALHARRDRQGRRMVFGAHRTAASNGLSCR